MSQADNSDPLERLDVEQKAWLADWVQSQQSKSLSRRAALTAGGAGIVGLLGVGTQTAAAGTNQVGTLGTDNERLDAEVEDVDFTDQGSTPTGPGSGQNRLYFKNGTPYYIPAGGSETSLGGSGDIASDDVSRIDVQSTTPSSPSTGDIWIDTS